MNYTITAVDMNAALPWRAHYIARAPDSGKLEPMRWPVVGMAARGDGLWPVRLEDNTGRGVLVGSDTDPLREGFLGVLVAGEPLSSLGDDVDERVRAMIRADLETDNDED